MAVRVLWSFLCLLFWGCKSYPEEMEVLKKSVELDYTSAEYRIYDTKKSNNRLLALEERGRLCQLKGDWRGSAKEYRAALDHLFRIQESKPLISVGDSLKDAIASTYGNELTRDYGPSAFEQMMLHTLDAFNSLALCEWDNFAVNVRNLETWRNEAEILIEMDVEALRNSGIVVNSSAASSLFKLNAVKRSTDNVYALYLIGLYHEIIGDLSNASIAYRDIARIHHGIGAVKEALRGVDSRVG